MIPNIVFPPVRSAISRASFQPPPSPSFTTQSYTSAPSRSALICDLTIARFKVFTPGLTCDATNQLDSSERPIPSNTKSQSSPAGTSFNSSSTQSLSSEPHRFRSRSVDICPEETAVTAPRSICRRSVPSPTNASRSSSPRFGKTSSTSSPAHRTTLSRNKRVSRAVTSFSAAHSFAASATLHCPSPLSCTSVRARRHMPITSAPALSQKITTRRHGFFLFFILAATASNESKRHPVSESALSSTTFLSRATRLRASAKVSARRAASRFEPRDSSSAAAAASATPCTAAAAPASKRFPAKQHSRTAFKTSTRFSSASEAASASEASLDGLELRVAFSFHTASISLASAGKSAAATAFSCAFIPANRSSNPRIRKSRSFSSTMSSKVAPASRATSASSPLETAFKYAS
mmetsp:Transcript_4204/g.16724  ORF Transcript_4204/g.16724 Transcript_4204/m.16724 type:complete len:407 (+) Transcript_4204:456-1676(+)